MLKQIVISGLVLASLQGISFAQTTTPAQAKKDASTAVINGIDRRTVDGADKYYQDCILRGDLEGALLAFEPNATYVGQDKVHHGLAEIRQGLAGVVGLKAHIVGVNRVTYTSGDIAGTVCEWHLQATTPDGKALDFTGKSSDVWHKGKDGIYRYLIDNAMGAQMLPQENK